MSEASSSSGKKKKIAAAAMAVVLAATLLIGGTVSYLTATSETVVNNFNSPDLEVDVDESTGNDYDIIPGTSEKKDPYVTVTSTPDYAYVYLFVVDETDELVSYTIADGWTKLYDDNDTSNPYAGTNITVYYRVASEGTNSYQVLKDDTVSYAGTITYEDLYDEDGNLRDDIKLSFYSIAVQCDGFENNPTGALSATVSTVNSAEALSTAAEGGGIIILTADITTTTSVNVDDGESLILYLDGYTLTNSSTDTVTVAEGGYAEISGGTIDATAHAQAAVLNEGGTVVISNTTLSRSAEAGTSSSDNGGNSYYVVANYGTMTLEDCTIESDGAFSSLILNSTDDEASAVAYLTIDGGTYTGGLNTILNSAGAILTIEDGTFTNSAQHLILNSGMATINGGTFTASSSGGAVVYNWYLGQSASSYGLYDEWYSETNSTVLMPAILRITGGTFTSENSYAIQSLTYSSESNTYVWGNTDISVSGGTFDDKYVIYPTDATYLASGYTLQSNDDGTYSVVASSTSSDE